MDNAAQSLPCADEGPQPRSPRKRWRPVSPTKGPWLIYSHYWGRWHRRSDDGDACGYTDDIAQAGIFDFAKAKAYHDWPRRGGRDEAIPVSAAAEKMAARLAEMDHERTELDAKMRLIVGAARATGPLSPLGQDRDETPSPTQRDET